jgi:hypothetical protein
MTIDESNAMGSDPYNSPTEHRFCIQLDKFQVNANARQHGRRGGERMGGRLRRNLSRHTDHDFTRSTAAINSA